MGHVQVGEPRHIPSWQPDGLTALQRPDMDRIERRGLQGGALPMSRTRFLAPFLFATGLFLAGCPKGGSTPAVSAAA